MNSDARVIPAPSTWSKPYWDGVADGRLTFQRCDDCRLAVFPPRRYCPACASGRLSWEESAGAGKVYSFSVIERGALEEFQADLPYVVAVVELDEGYRMVSRVIDCEPSAVRCDARVAVAFGAADSPLPMFRLAVA